MMLLAVLLICAELAVIKCQEDDIAIAFSVGLDNIKQTFPADTVLIFNRVIFSQGGGYSNSTGVFTAPEDGVYHFQIQGLSRSGSRFFITLQHNDNPIISAYANQEKNYDSASNSVLLGLKQGGRVYVKTNRDSSFYGKPAEIYSTFSGHRVGALCDSS